jgi:hypothetical protein
VLKWASQHIRESLTAPAGIVEVTTPASAIANHTMPANQVLMSLQIPPEALLLLVRDDWRKEGWHWIRNTQIHKNSHRFQRLEPVPAGGTRLFTSPNREHSGK